MYELFLDVMGSINEYSGVIIASIFALVARYVLPFVREDRNRRRLQSFYDAVVMAIKVAEVVVPQEVNNIEQRIHEIPAKVKARAVELLGDTHEFLFPDEGYSSEDIIKAVDNIYNQLLAEGEILFDLTGVKDEQP